MYSISNVKPSVNYCNSSSHAWESDHPDVITGWNTERFDIPHICNRIKSVMGEDANETTIALGCCQRMVNSGAYGKGSSL